MRRARLLSLIAALCAAAACASLPPPPGNPRSTSFAQPASTSLGEVVRSSAPNSSVSGFRLLVSGEDALGSLLALARHAQHSLDIQYYIVRNDASSRTVLREVHAAARRGVRVRMLVDDLNTASSDESLLCLTRHPAIELRLYNPLPAGRFSTVTRVLASLTDIARINQRMHAKMFVADNAIGITGGRNLRDEYFLRSPTSNFVDLDVIAAGPAVRALSASFDRFWNSELAYPIAQLVKTEPDCAGPVSAEPASPSPVPVAQWEAGQQGTESQQAPGREGTDDVPDPSSALARELEAGRLEMSWLSASVVADEPAKIEEGADVRGQREARSRSADAADAADAADTADALASPMEASSAAPAVPANSGGANAAQAGPGHPVAATVARLIGSARRELIVITPYFVPGPHGMALFRELRERGVTIRVLTNSLASTDAPVVHIGYARYREELLWLGVELHELRNQPGPRRSHFAGFGSSLASLHAKALVIDRNTALIGSMNTDPRSEWLNTELGLVLPSPEISGQLVALYDDVVDSSYRLQLAEGGSRQWVGGSAGEPTVEGQEPGASLAMRALLLLLTPFAPEEML